MSLGVDDVYCFPHWLCEHADFDKGIYMHETLGGKSLLTSKLALLTYYICALSSFFTGFTIFIAAFGVIVSRYIAHKEMAPRVAQHCTWILRSIWVTALLTVICIVAAICIIGESNIIVPNTDFVKNFSDLWNNTPLREGLQYTVTLLCILFILGCWFIYRMLRGIIALLHSRPIKLSTIRHTL